MRADSATVASSDRAKEYSVLWAGKVYSSNDNATHWQGYAGYPVIAVLMLRGLLPFEQSVAAMFAGVNWAKANAAAKRDYAKALEAVFAQLGLGEEQAALARAQAREALAALAELDMEIQRRDPRKPKT